MRFPPAATAFLAELQRHNEREWFNARKPRYTACLAEVKAFAADVRERLAREDVLAEGKQPVTRIYRDTRFSKDKTPYKRHWGGGLDRLGAERRGGYYWHVEPGGLKTWGEFDGGYDAFVGGGFWAPERDDLARIREELAVDHDAFRKLLRSEPVAGTFGGDLHPANLLKTAPKGYPRDHPAIDLLRHKSFVLVRYFTAAEVARADFSAEVAGTFAAMRPFLDYMSTVLTTDSNGVSIV